MTFKSSGLLLGAFICLAVPIQADIKVSPAPQQKSNQQILQEYGAQIMTTAPAAIQQGSNIVKARYAFTQYCQRLNGAGTPVNATLTGRALQLFGSGDASRWTCGDHALNLEGLFKGAGVNQKDVVYLEADSNSWLPTPNADHGALVVRGEDGKAFVFDAWGLAVNNLNNWYDGTGTYKGAYDGSETSEWNGMDLQAWDDTMKAAGFVRFTVNGGTTYSTTCQGAVQMYLKDMSQSPTFEGAWSGRFTGSAGGSITFNVRGSAVSGLISGSSQGDPVSGHFSGTVDAAGTVRTTLTGSLTDSSKFQLGAFPFSGHLNGQLSGKSGSGTWSARNQQGTSSGNWSATRH